MSTLRCAAGPKSIEPTLRVHGKWIQGPTTSLVSSLLVARARKDSIVAGRNGSNQPPTNSIGRRRARRASRCVTGEMRSQYGRSEEHTSELQSHHDLVCRLL